MMSNEEIMNILNWLKSEGVSFKYLAKQSDISYDTFYYYRRCKQFPLLERKKVEKAIIENFGEVLDEYRK